MLGTMHCGLCDVTHSWGRKLQWDAMVARLGIPFGRLHLNEMDAGTAEAVKLAGSQVVFARTDAGLRPSPMRMTSTGQRESSSGGCTGGCPQSSPDGLLRSGDDLIARDSACAPTRLRLDGRLHPGPKFSEGACCLCARGIAPDRSSHRAHPLDLHGRRDDHVGAANLTKITHGAWLPLAIAVVAYLILMTWYRGRKIVTAQRESKEGRSTTSRTRSRVAGCR